MYRVLNDIIGEFISFAVSDTRFNTASGHPHGKASGMVVTPIDLFSKFTLAISAPTELTTPYHQSIVEQTSFLQIFYQCGLGLINISRLITNATR